MSPSERARPLAPTPPYTYRRTLRAQELIVPVAVGAGVGILAGYVAWVLTQRTPLVPVRSADRERESRLQRRLRA
jgi:hypothetical protein